MCQLKSCLVLKDRIYCPDYDSHDRMLNELHIADTIQNAESLFVRVELTPPNEKLNTPFNEWRLNIDQDFLPDWWDKDYYEPLVRAEVKKWIDEHFIYSGTRKISQGTYYALNDAEVIAENDSVVNAFNHATVCSHDSSLIFAHHNATINARMQSTVYATDNCKVVAYNNAFVNICDDVQAEVYDRAQARIRDNSEVKAYDASTILCFNNTKVICNDMSRCFACEADEVVANGNSVIYLRNHAHAHVIANDNSIVFKKEDNNSEITLNNNALTTTLIK